jgi:phthiocerol/phenolphthiocerol synthesis type-I polyketide synthase C
MDPQQRLLLELAYEAMEDAGIDAAALAGEKVGVFIGGSSWDYLNLNLGDPATTDAYTMIGITLSPLANRISYAFDLHGPSFTVDTACSSSLVALHQACEAMRLGQIDKALVGGVSMLLAPQSFIGFCAASMLSPNGRCHAFDARANGYVRAEGGGMVLLKPLGAALAAGDPIRAIIRGTGVNSDGRTPGLSLPNKRAQAALLQEIYTRFGLETSDLVYVEAHGTGTPAGDPIEAGALGSVLGANRSAPLTIGSVKTNIGHLEAGSGMAGLLKAMLVAERGVIPPSLHNETPNPNIPFAELNLQLATDTIILPDDGARHLVGVNSFGFGGTNAHTVLQAPEPRMAAPVRRETEDRLPPLLISARSEGALRDLAAAWRDRLTAADAIGCPACTRARCGASSDATSAPSDDPRRQHCRNDRSDRRPSGRQARRRCRQQCGFGRRRLHIFGQWQPVGGHGGRRHGQQCQLPGRDGRSRCGACPVAGLVRYRGACRAGCGSVAQHRCRPAFAVRHSGRSGDGAAHGRGSSPMRAWAIASARLPPPGRAVRSICRAQRA